MALPFLQTETKKYLKAWAFNFNVQLKNVQLCFNDLSRTFLSTAQVVVIVIKI